MNYIMKIVSSLAEADEIIPNLTNEKEIFPWNNNLELKSRIAARDKRKKSKNVGKNNENKKAN